MLASHGPRVLVIDSDPGRARELGVFLRLSGCEVAHAADVVQGAELFARADVAVLDDDAFGRAGTSLFSRLGRVAPGVFRCVACRWSRFADVRGCADYVLAKPYTSAVLADALVASRSLRRAAPEHGADAAT